MDWLLQQNNLNSTFPESEELGTWMRISYVLDVFPLLFSIRENLLFSAALNGWIEQNRRMRIDADTISCYLSQIGMRSTLTTATKCIAVCWLRWLFRFRVFFRLHFARVLRIPLPSAATHQHPQPTHYGLCQRLLNRIELNGCCNAPAAVELCGKCSNLGALNTIFFSIFSPHLPQLPVLPLPPHCWFVFIWTSQSNGSFCEILFFVLSFESWLSSSRSALLQS